MKVAILAGGFGTRLAEETDARPKPMVEIGGRPILWHILKIYAHYGLNEFVIALGYKGEVIKRYWLEYGALDGDMTVRIGHRDGVERHGRPMESWSVDLVETGLHTQTGGRIRRLGPHLGDETFLLTWGDGVADVDVKRLLDFHRSHGKLVTVTAVRPPARFGHLEFDGDRVMEFSEKPQTAEGWINGAFFVVEPGALEYIDGDATQFELEPMMQLAREGQLMAYRHDGFWQCMDTLRDRARLEKLWASGAAPWKVWA